MTLKLMSAAEMEADQRAFREQVAKREPWLANLRAATVDAHDDGGLLFRDRGYTVPPIRYAVGQRIEGLDRHIARCGRELKEMEEAGRTSFEADAGVRHLTVERARSYEQLAAIYRDCVRPVGWWARLTWRWRENPFFDATEQEIEDLAAFFREARTISHVKALESIRAPLFLRSTFPPTAGPLSLAIPPSLRREALSRVAGATSGKAPQ